MECVCQKYGIQVLYMETRLMQNTDNFFLAFWDYYA